MPSQLLLVPLGFAVGAFGTLIGAGGGFVLVPVLLLLNPHERPEVITSISLAVVFFNALSGSVAYARLGRVDYRSGLLFAAATVPGAILGVFTTSWIPRRAFDIVFGVLLLAASVFLVASPGTGASRAQKGRRGAVSRTLVEVDGTTYTYSYSPVVGTSLSAVVGYLSSLLGIGGGIIHVPVLARVLGFPVHVATATSHFVLAVMALAGTLVHLANGSLQGAATQVAALAAGVLVGAQVGAAFSGRVRGSGILRSLGTALGLVAIRVLVSAFR